MLDSARTAAAAVEAAATAAAASPPNPQKQQRAADALKDFCQAIIDLAKGQDEVEDSEDAVSVLVGMLGARAPGVAASAASALAAMMASTTQHGDAPAASSSFKAGSTSFKDASSPDKSRRGSLQLEHSNDQSERWMQQEAIRETYGMPKLVKMMISREGKERCAAANALSNATDRNVDNCDAIRDAGGLAVLHTLLTKVMADNASDDDIDEDQTIKFWAMATLGNLAASSDANRNAIMELDVIQLLVNMTTQAGTKVHKVKVGEEKEGGEEKELQLVAGEVLSSMLAKGDKSIEMAIVSGIVAAVRRQGAKPPTAFPDLMRSLQTAARERLQKVQTGTDAAALHLALDFGRWIMLPTVLLGTARNEFKARQVTALKEERHRLRQVEMGLNRGSSSPLGSPTASAIDWAAKSASSSPNTPATAAAEVAESDNAEQMRNGQKAARGTRAGSPQHGSSSKDGCRQQRAWTAAEARERAKSEARRLVMDEAGDVQVRPTRNYPRPWASASRRPSKPAISAVGWLPLGVADDISRCATSEETRFGAGGGAGADERRRFRPPFHQPLPAAARAGGTTPARRAGSSPPPDFVHPSWRSIAAVPSPPSQRSQRGASSSSKQQQASHRSQDSHRSFRALQGQTTASTRKELLANPTGVVGGGGGRRARPNLNIIHEGSGAPSAAESGSSRSHQTSSRNSTVRPGKINISGGGSNQSSHRQGGGGGSGGNFASGGVGQSSSRQSSHRQGAGSGSNRGGGSSNRGQTHRSRRARKPTVELLEPPSRLPVVAESTLFTLVEGDEDASTPTPCRPSSPTAEMAAVQSGPTSLQKRYLERAAATSQPGDVVNLH